MKASNILTIVESLQAGNYLYHATFKPLLDSIRQHGLGGNGSEQKRYTDSKHGIVYLANDPDVAESYAEVAEDIPDDWLDEIVILKINVSKLDQSKLSRDRNVIGGDDTFEYSGVIPYSAIEIFR